MKKRKKLRRADSFLGIHFDFHAKETDTNIGENTTREMIQEIIDKTGVDYIQTDCKGHPGYTSYPSKIGNAAAGIKKDALRLWREVTEENGVALYVHYSGVWDTNAISKHPEWARIDENGNIDKNNISLSSNYVDELLIPQLIELCDDYKVDGVWIDGDCWATCQDYSQKALLEFKEKTGIERVPKTSDDPYFFEFMQFTREKFREYLRYYTDKIHSHNKEFQVCSNWAFTSYMPGPVSANVDFLSGDYPLNNSVKVAQFEARCMQNQGLPWDLMAWGFSGRFDKGLFSTKSAVQLKQEAAIVLSLGGGFQVYFMQNRDGSIKRYVLDIMSEVAAFCRERQEFCHKAKPIPQIALLDSAYNFYKKNKKVFGGWDNIIQNISGLLQCLINSQKCVEVIMEHNDLEKYPCIILPELKYLEQEYIGRLLKYVKNGGRLLVIGEAIEMFKDELGVEFDDSAEQDVPQYLKYNNSVCAVELKHYHVRAKNGTKTSGELIANDDYDEKGTPAATICEYGKGKIGAIYFQLGENYNIGNISLIRDFLSDVVNEIFPEQVLKIEGSHSVDVTLMEKDNKMIINLTNTNGEHANEAVYVYDEIPPTGELTITIRLNKKINKIVLQPEGKELGFAQNNGEITVKLHNIEIHNVLVVY